ncbi:MAG: nicotinate phosphoribosyltransferase [Gaiellales bacterium]
MSVAPPASPLLVDLYELTMAETYLVEGMNDRWATFSLYVRHLPRGWGYLVAAGLDDVLGYLEGLRFGEHELAQLDSTGLFSAALLERLRGFRFQGDVRAMPEGTLCFPDEPLLEVHAPIIEAQLIETVVLNLIHFQTLIAAKASRCVTAARGRPLVDFSLRRTHGADAGIAVARASHLAGFASSSDVLAGSRFHIPIAGTMAHSFVEAFPDELSAFRAFADRYPDTCVLLIDTYDTIEGARRAATVAGELAQRGHRLRGVRLDSGDLDELSRAVREILDRAGHRDAIIFASGNLDEVAVSALVSAGAPIDSFGVGTRMGVSADAPYLDIAYKLVQLNGRPVLKLSAGKATWPGAKQVWRETAGDGRFGGDIIGLAREPAPEGSSPLLVEAMRRGRRLHRESLAVARERCAGQRALLPPPQLRLHAAPYPVAFSRRLTTLRARCAAEAGDGSAGGARDVLPTGAGARGA